jgi:hypothetical protein
VTPCAGLCSRRSIAAAGQRSKQSLVSYPYPGDGSGKDQSHCFALPCPGGTFENSPTLQRWDRWPKGNSPEGTAEECCSIQPSLRDLGLYKLVPNAEALGYSHASLRDEIPLAANLILERCRINAAFRLLRNAAFMRQRRFKISKCELRVITSFDCYSRVGLIN